MDKEDNNTINKFKNLIDDKSVRIVLQGTLVIAIGIATNLAWPLNFSSFYGIITAAFFFILVFLHILLLVHYAKQDEIDKYKAKLNKNSMIYPDMVRSISDFCDESAIGATKVIHSIKNNCKADLELWNFSFASRSLCKSIYEVLKKIAINDDDIEIIIDRLIEGGNERTICTCGFYNKQGNQPSDLKRYRNIDTDKKYDSSVFADKKSNPIVYSDPKKLQNKYYPHNSSKTEKYRQAIFYPVYCDDRKMVCLICVVCIGNTILGSDDNELADIANNYIRPFAKLTLLAHKLEKGLTAQPEK